MTAEELDNWRWSVVEDWFPAAEKVGWPPSKSAAPALVYVYRCMVREGITPESFVDPPAEREA